MQQVRREVSEPKSRSSDPCLQTRYKEKREEERGWALGLKNPPFANCAKDGAPSRLFEVGMTMLVEAGKRLWDLVK